MQKNDFLYSAQEWQESMIADIELCGDKVLKRGKPIACKITKIEQEQLLDDFK